ncbi:hypothetical protein JNM87_06280 [Candidatus Saccharibacteria bacterium]|nr:hypothetical protein [Candidatus Saccharibacteria bacterium]
METRQIMDDATARQLVRQLKIMNFWVTLFGSMIVLTLVVLGFFIFKIVTFVHSTEQKVSDLQRKTTQTLNVKDDLCKNSLLSGSGYCKK